MDAFGYVACTGTNLCIRARALAAVGWFPTYTITEGGSCRRGRVRAGRGACWGMVCRRACCSRPRRPSGAGSQACRCGAPGRGGSLSLSAPAPVPPPGPGAEKLVHVESRAPGQGVGRRAPPSLSLARARRRGLLPPMRLNPRSPQSTQPHTQPHRIALTYIRSQSKSIAQPHSINAPPMTDYALSMELKAAGFKGRYLAEYLAVGAVDWVDWVDWD